ncbi:MAG: hypothetical protein GY756_27535 [bacterium]|nr:hypothetical protein [bacterium]
MAQMISDRMSTYRISNFSYRHTRLCKINNGGEEFISLIEDYLNKLNEAEKVTLKAKLDRETAYDDAIVCNHALDDSVRYCHEKGKKYDRDNPGSQILKVLFPDGKFSTITKASLRLEPDKAEQLVQRIGSLGAEHIMNELVSELSEGISKCRAALSVYYIAITNQKSAEALEAVAKTNLIKQYSNNYHDIVKKFGRSYANRFFPVINSSSKNKIEDETADTNTEEK